ncbi:MAG: phenylacetate--CoA ligase family protein [Phycisphaerae bacterium]|nr:phenylacetate--CoA ligase family protein [Phycisphaerae bacterium]
MQSFANRAISWLWYYCGSRRRRRSRREADETERAHRWSRERIEQYSQERLTVLLRRAAQMVPYYSRLFAERGWDPQQAEKYWPKWPVLSQQMLQERRDELVAKDVEKSNLRLGASGGSTGHNKTFYHGREYGQSKAAAVTHSDTIAGWKPGHRIALLWGAPPRVLSTVRPLSPPPPLRSLRKNQRLYNSYDMSEARKGEYHLKLSRYRPDIIIAYAGAVFEMARFLKSNRLCPDYPSKSIISSAETLSEPMRLQIDEVFGKPIFNRYGSWEVGLMGFECEAHTGLHMAFTHNLIEVVNPGSLEPIWDQQGDILVTTLGEPDCPLIRYQIGDVGIMTRRLCSCGRNSLRLREVSGREMDFISTPGGGRIHGAFGLSAFYGIEKVRQFQVVQRKLDRIDVRLVLAAALSKDEEARIRSVFRERLGPDVAFQIRIVDRIDPLPSGKRAFLVSELQ